MITYAPQDIFQTLPVDGRLCVCKKKIAILLIDKVKGVLAAAEEELHLEQSAEVAQELP